MNPGYLYILVNPGLKKDLLKIGKTTRDPELRSDEISKGTGVPMSYYVAFSIETEDCDKAERLVHERLSGYRLNESREFFTLPLSEAISYIRDVCDSIFSEADLLKIAHSHLHKEEYELAIHNFERAAKMGNAEAQFQMWKMFSDGWGDLDNFDEGLEYLKSSALQGNPESAYELAIMYAEEILGGNEYAEMAIFWGKKSVAAGNYKAANIVGNMLAVDRPRIGKNEVEANRWFKIASDHGDPYATFQLGVSYEAGLGFEPNLEKAAEYYRLAAEAGSNQAKQRLIVLSRLHEV